MRLNRIIILGAAAALTLGMQAARPKADGSDRLFRYAYKARTAPNGLDARHSALIAAKAKAPQATTLPASDYIQYIDGPDGSSWFYTVKFDIDKVPVEGGYEGLTEDLIKGFTYTIYDNHFNTVGTVCDTISLRDDETRVAAVELVPVVTTKFFNNDSRYEVMVTTACNRDWNTNPYPYVAYHSKAYSIGGQRDDAGHDIALTEIDGYMVDAINGAPDAWSEKFYITFMTESIDMSQEDYVDMLNSASNDLHIYKSAGWGSAPTVIADLSVGSSRAPGDQQTAPFMISYRRGNNVYFATVAYDKPYFLDPLAEDLQPTPDNSLVIDIKRVQGNQLVDEQHTAIALEQDTAAGGLCTYYTVGNCLYTGDFDYGTIDTNNPNKAAFIVTRQILLNYNDDCLYSLLHYDAQGNCLRQVMDNCERFVLMSDLPGTEPQAMAIRSNEGTGYKMEFVDLLSGQSIQSLSFEHQGLKLTATVDRAVMPDGGYCWVFGTNQANLDEDNNAIEHVAWINTDGSVRRVDDVNLGKNVAYAMMYISAEALSPYFFNTDADQEYMVLVKRYTGNETSTREELLIIGRDGRVLLNAVPDGERGALANIGVMNLDSNPSLAVVYYNNTTGQYSQEYYSLPLERFAGGEGTVENPYLIATAGDLQQLRQYPAAHYRLTADINARGVEFSPVDAAFSGSIDGAGYTVSNLTVNSANSVCALFEQLMPGAKVSNLTFRNVTMQADDQTGTVALLAASAVGTTVENIHVYGLHAELPEGCEANVGGLVGRMANKTAIVESSVVNALVVAPNSLVGGIAAEAYTGSSVNGAAFVGYVHGNSEVGGIIGKTGSTDITVRNCHVDADLIANNTVGGIVGYAKRGSISNCHVQGSISAMAPPQWYNYGPCAGGIVGELEPEYAPAEEPEQPVTPTAAITHCYVNMSSIGYDTIRNPFGTAADWDGQLATAHRIVGRTRANHQPEAGVNTDPEAGLVDNYAAASLTSSLYGPTDRTDSVDGCDLSTDQATDEFFSGIGYAYGNTADAPWMTGSAAEPALHYEVKAIAEQPEIYVQRDEVFDVATLIIDKTDHSLHNCLTDAVCEVSDYDVVATTGICGYRDFNNLVFQFVALEPGVCTLTLGIPGQTAVTTVYVSENSGIDNTVADSRLTIAYNGTDITAPGCALRLYNAAGRLAATGRDSLGTARLTPGLYIAHATDRTGRTAVAKVVVK